MYEVATSPKEKEDPGSSWITLRHPPPSCTIPTVQVPTTHHYPHITNGLTSPPYGVRSTTEAKHDGHGGSSTSNLYILHFPPSLLFFNFLPNPRHPQTPPLSPLPLPRHIITLAVDDSNTLYRRHHNPHPSRSWSGRTNLPTVDNGQSLSAHPIIARAPQHQRRLAITPTTTTPPLHRRLASKRDHPLRHPLGKNPLEKTLYGK